MKAPAQSAASPVCATLRNPSLVDFPGRMAALMFTTGCNFRCGFCHNAALLQEFREGYAWGNLERKCRQFRAQWVDAVVVTGGEPTLAPELPGLCQFLRDQGFAVKLDTNGSRPDVLADVLPLVDYVAMDVKCTLPRYPAFVSFSRAKPIAESIRLLLDSDVAFEFRTTVLPSVHTETEMRGIGDLVQDAPRFVLQPFVPRDDLPDPALRKEPRTPAGVLTRLGSVMEEYVQQVVVRGT